MKYITDAADFLSVAGGAGIGGAENTHLSDFFAAVVAATTQQSAAAGTLTCVECSTPGRIEADFGPDDVIQWYCAPCGCGGEISNWRCTRWDVTAPHRGAR